MFLSNLNDQQQRLLVQCAVAIAAIDGSIDGREDSLISRLLADPDANVSADEARALVIPETLPQAIAEAFNDTPDDSSRRAFLAEVAQMVTADGVATTDEVSLLDSFVTALGISSDETAAFIAAGDGMREAQAVVRQLVGS